jgi:hypothetical protein
MQLTSFSPDADPRSEGVVPDCENIVPTLRGLAAAPSLIMSSAAPNPLPANCVGAAVLRRLDETRRVIAGTQSKLYELVSGAWTDVSKPGDYSGGVDTRWRFVQFGNVSLACNGVQKLQQSTTGGFSDIADSPVGSKVCAAAGFVLLGDLSTAPDGWAASNIYDYLTWTPASNNVASNGRLLDTPGRITAMVGLGQDVIAYKERSVYIGRYADSVIKWTWQLVPFSDGAVSQEAVVDIDGAHLFLGTSNFYLFDGSRPTPIGNPVREWYLQNSNPNLRFKTEGVFDRTKRTVTWHFYGLDSTYKNLGLVYHIDTGRWGKVNYAVQSAVVFVQPARVIDSLTEVVDTLSLPIDSPFYVGGAESSAVFDQSGYLKLLAGTPGASYITTGIMGADGFYTRVSRVRPHFLVRPTTATMDHLCKDESAGVSMIVAGSSYLSDSGFDSIYECRYHQFSMRFTGQMEITGYEVEQTGRSL